jgi:hypothetical protein
VGRTSDMRRIVGWIAIAVVFGAFAILLDAAPSNAWGARLWQESNLSVVTIHVLGEDGMGVRGASLYSTGAGCELLGRTDESGRSTVKLAVPSTIVVATELFRTQVVECGAGQLSVNLELKRASSVNVSVDGFKLPDDRMSIEICDPLGRVFRDPSQSLTEPRLHVMGVEKTREQVRVHNGNSSHVVQLTPVRTGSYWLPDVASPSLLEFRLIDALGGQLCDAVRARQAPTDSRQWAASVAAAQPTVRPTLRVLDSAGQAMPRQKFRVFALATDSRVNMGRVQLAAETDAHGVIALPPLAITVITVEERTMRSAERRGGEVRLREGQLEYEVVLRRN